MRILSNILPLQESRELLKHFSDTYFSLRICLVILAFAMPFVLYLYGKFLHGMDLQPSMSAYFWAAGEDQCATFPMRTIFVGFLCAIGVGLYVYKGLTPLENTLLNASAVCAALVAVFPERISADEAASVPQVAQLLQSCPAVKELASQAALPVHSMAAVLLFLFLAIVAWFCANKSLEYLPPDQDLAKFQRAYKVIAIAMIIFPITGITLSLIFGATSNKIFFIEAAGVLTFGVYWLTKSYEISLSRMEKDPIAALQNVAKRQADISLKGK